MATDPAWSMDVTDSSSRKSSALAIGIAAVIVYQVCMWLLWLRRERQFLAFARENGCQTPATIQGSLFSGIRHKWNRLNQPGDMFNDYMNGVFQKHGPTHAIVRLFTQEIKTIHTIEPENVRTLLSLKFPHYYRPRTMPNALDPVMGEGVFTSNGSAWSHSRKLVKAQFSTKRIRNVAKLESHVQNMFEALGAVGADGWTQEQDVLPIFNRFTLDAATEFMFGMSAESHEAAMRERTGRSHGGSGRPDFWTRNSLIMSDFGTAFDTALDYVALRLKLGRLWFLADGLSFRLACHKVKTFADNYIRDAAAHAATALAAQEGNEKPVDVEEHAGDDDRRYGLISDLVHDYPDRVALRNQVMQLLVAGRDTTAATLTWAFALLEAHPATFRKLRAAVVRAFGTDAAPRAPVDFDGLRACAYLQYVVAEVVRLYPTGPLNARRAGRDTVLPVGGGPDGRAPLAVKAGTTVAYNVYLLHRRRDLWGGDAWEFRPERWQGRRAGWEYVPFHGGPQTCLGQQHALTEMAYVIVRVLQRFDAVESSTRATNFENGIRTILVPKNGVMLRFRASR